LPNSERIVMKPLEFVVKCGRYAARLPRRVLESVDESQKKEHCILEPGAKLLASCRINGTCERGRIRIGANTHVKGILQIFPNGGEICIGRDCFIGEWTHIWSMASVKIGDRVLVSHNVNIHDNNGHSLSAGERHKHYMEIITVGHPEKLDDIVCKPVVIEDDAWIGFNSTILKGVTIGRGAVVGACSVVIEDVAPYEVVAGNPARVVGRSLP
jgi:acetyltransferase-like isoleucine patch superfamily enzyme